MKQTSESKILSSIDKSGKQPEQQTVPIMAEPLKNILNERYFNGFANALKSVIGDFDKHLFLSRIVDDEWENRELKQRMRHVSTVLKDFLPANYKEAVSKIVELTNHLKKGFVPKEDQFGPSFQ